MLGGTANRQSVDRVGIAITIAIIQTSATVTGGPDKNRSATMSSLFDAIDKGTFGQLSRTIDRLAIVFGSPRRRIDVDVVGIVADGLGLHLVGDHTVQHAHAANARVEGDAHTTKAVISFGGHLASTSSTMSRFRKCNCKLLCYHKPRGYRTHLLSPLSCGVGSESLSLMS